MFKASNKENLGDAIIGFVDINLTSCNLFLPRRSAHIVKNFPGNDNIIRSAFAKEKSALAR